MLTGLQAGRCRGAARAPAARRAQRGLSLVELMVGMAIGLFIVAAATLVVTNQLGENRRLLLEAQVQQDLRAAAEIMAREIRRAGSVNDDDVRSVAWFPGTPGVLRNAFAPIGIGSAAGVFGATAADCTGICFNYVRAAGVVGPFGYRRQERTVGGRTVGVVQTNLGGIAGSNWQDLTDPNTLDVTELTFTELLPEADFPPPVLACPDDCPGGGQDCWPRLRVREIGVRISGRALRDDAVRRTVEIRVRPRADWIEYRSAGSAVPNAQVPACP